MKPFVISMLILIAITVALIFGSLILSNHITALLDEIVEFSEDQQSFSNEENKDRVTTMETLWLTKRSLFSHCFQREELEKIDQLFHHMKASLEEDHYMTYLVSKRDLEWQLNQLLEKQKITGSIIF